MMIRYNCLYDGLTRVYDDDFNNSSSSALFCLALHVYRLRYRIFALKHRPGRSVNVSVVSALLDSIVYQMKSKKNLHLSNVSFPSHSR